SKLKYGLAFHWYELQNDLYPVLWGYGGGPPNCLLPNGQLDQPLDCTANLDALAMFYGLIYFDRITPDLSTLRAASLTQEKRLFESFAMGETVFMIDWTNR